MAFGSTVLKVLIGSPSDLSEERDAAEAAVHEWNAHNAEAERVMLLPVRWETQTFPVAGVRPQDAINRQIVDGSDILLALFWTRLGTDTGLASSGTVEEVDRFAAAAKPVMIYFSGRPVNPATIDVKQLSRLQDFRVSTYSTALTATFSSLEELGHRLFKDMTSLVRQIQSQRSGPIVDQLADQEDAAETDMPEDFYKAKPDWDLWDYQKAHLMATHVGLVGLAAALEADFKNTSFAGSPDDVAEWQAWIEYSRLRAGNGGDLNRISRLAEAHPANSKIRFTLGSALALYDKSAAARAFREAAAAARDPDDVYRAVKRAVSLEADAELPSETNSLLELIARVAVPEGSDQVSAVEALGVVAKARGLDSIALALAEHSTSLTPHDTDLRFSHAHDLADGGRTALAKLHYEKIPPMVRSGAAWNNLGVALQALDMPGAAVAAYDEASKLAETIADSNAANKLREAGFFQQAQQRLETALAVPGYDPNVVASLAALREARLEEEQLNQSVLKVARAEHDFGDAVGKAATAVAAIDVTGQWDIGECVLDVTPNGSDGLVGLGSFQREETGIAAALMRPSFLTPTTIEVRVELRRLGNAFEGKISRIPSDHTPSLLGDMFLHTNLVAHVGPDGHELNVWEAGSELPAAVWRRATPGNT